MFLTVEPFLLQDERRDAIGEQPQARIVGPGYEPKNLHGDTLF